jgi:protease I
MTSMANLNGLKVAILIENGFEQVEMTEPRKALDQAGAETSIVSPRRDRVRGWNFSDWGEEFPVDVNLDSFGDDFPHPHRYVPRPETLTHCCCPAA